MSLKLATSFASIALAIAPVSAADASVIYTCKFEVGVVVINHLGPENAVVQLAGEDRRYVFDDEKLVPRDTGLPTFLFQSGLKRWKLLNESGETLEITICKAAASSATQ
ncbi:MAG: hypothetical protein EOO23_08965 [Comamonadaceae bacterium]|nr:MAG: hypothetical protein EOO23_08965 [Comamonadaceae bacterium]